MLIIVPVKIDEQFESVSKTLRTEDVRDYIKDVYDNDQTIISFYEHLDSLIIQEDFNSFHKRFSEIENPYYDLDDNEKSEQRNHNKSI